MQIYDTVYAEIALLFMIYIFRFD